MKKNKPEKSRAKSGTGVRKQLTGTVLSVKMQKTAVVRVEHLKKHPLYGKYLKRSRKIYVQNDLNAASGDRVLVKQVRPLSRLKRWVITEVLT